MAKARAALVRIVIVVGQYFVRSNSCEVVDIARLGKSNNWMEEKHAIDIFCGAPGQFFMSAVERVPRLKRNNIFSPICSRRSRVWLESNVVLESHTVEEGVALSSARDISFTPSIHLSDQRMSHVGSLKDFLSCFLKIPFVNFVDVHHGYDFITCIE